MKLNKRLDSGVTVATGVKSGKASIRYDESVGAIRLLILLSFTYLSARSRAKLRHGLLFNSRELINFIIQLFGFGFQLGNVI